MKSLTFKSLILLLMPFCVAAQIKLERRSLLDNKIELLVPSYFKPMTAEMLDQKYPNRNQQPNLVLTDADTEVNIVVSQVNQRLDAEHVALYKDFLQGSLKRSHPDAKWLDGGVKSVNGKNIGYLKFITNGSDQAIFNYYFFTDMDGKILLLTFNCTEALLPKWKDTAETIVGSLKIL